MNNELFQSDRLAFRQFNAEDAYEIYLLNIDPEVLKYTGDAPFESVDAAKTFLENYKQYELHGMGRWAVIRKEDEAFLGWCGLKYRPDQETVDLGYRFKKEYWGKGYATEAARASLKYGFEVLQLQRIIARAMKDNGASIRVIEKVGMTYVSETVCGLHDAFEFEIFK